MLISVTKRISPPSSPSPSSSCRVLKEYLGEKEVELSLTFDAAEEADLGNYTCHVENHIGKRSGSAILQKRGEGLQEKVLRNHKYHCITLHRPISP